MFEQNYLQLQFDYKLRANYKIDHTEINTFEVSEMKGDMYNKDILSAKTGRTKLNGSGILT